MTRDQQLIADRLLQPLRYARSQQNHLLQQTYGTRMPRSDQVECLEREREIEVIDLILSVIVTDPTIA